MKIYYVSYFDNQKCKFKKRTFLSKKSAQKYCNKIEKENPSADCIEIKEEKIGARDIPILSIFVLLVLLTAFSCSSFVVRLIDDLSTKTEEHYYERVDFDYINDSQKYDVYIPNLGEKHILIPKSNVDVSYYHITETEEPFMKMDVEVLKHISGIFKKTYYTYNAYLEIHMPALITYEF